jgi:hypothetical protein
VGHSDAKHMRIVTLGFGTGRQKMALERWTTPKLSRRTCAYEYGLQSCRGKSAGVAKRPRDRVSDLPPEIPYVAIRFFIAAQAAWDVPVATYRASTPIPPRPPMVGPHLCISSGCNNTVSSVTSGSCRKPHPTPHRFTVRP